MRVMTSTLNGVTVGLSDMVQNDDNADFAHDFVEWSTTHGISGSSCQGLAHGWVGLRWGCRLEHLHASFPWGLGFLSTGLKCKCA